MRGSLDHFLCMHNFSSPDIPPTVTFLDNNLKTEMRATIGESYRYGSFIRDNCRTGFLLRLLRVTIAYDPCLTSCPRV